MIKARTLRCLCTPTMRSVLIFVALLGLSAASVLPEVVRNVLARESRVVNGVPATPGEFPYQGSLQLRSSHYCGCTILSAEWALTAAHCVYGNTAADYQIRVGTNQWASGGSVHAVASFEYHAGYQNFQYWPNDIAVVRVATPFVIDNTLVGTTTLAADGSDVPSGTPAIVEGWGSVQYGGAVQPDLLRADVSVVSDAECLAAFGEGPTAEMICAGGGGTGICSGDSGGPLLVNGEQVGITSWTRIPCAQIPAVWTQVSYFRQWIFDRTGV
ncbi:hypothetical protein B566_EDAN004907 [Ephemera danica]|nr:hypothetical protein B566_EDAN004907 [Ephemera danica]